MIRLLFDFPGTRGTPVRRTFEQPAKVIRASSLEHVRSALHQAAAAARAGCWVAGFVSYEAAPAFDAAMQTHPPGRLPLLWPDVFDRAVESAPLPHPRVTPPFLTWKTATRRARYDKDFARIREALLNGEAYQVNHTTRLHATLPRGSTPMRRTPHCAAPRATGTTPTSTSAACAFCRQVRSCSLRGAAAPSRCVR